MSSASQLGTALITGASSGIGATYADRLARRGYDLILIARNKSKLEALATELSTKTAVRIRAIPADLTIQQDLDRVEQLLHDDTSVTFLVDNPGDAWPARDRRLRAPRP